MARHAAEEEVDLLPADSAHDALLYDSPEHLTAVAAPFLQEGLACGDTVVLAAGGPAAQVLHDAVDRDPQVIVLDRADVYRSPTPAALTTFRRLVGRRTGVADSQVRVVGEVDFGPTRRHWPEWQRFEAVMNHYLRDGALWGLCLYDTQHLPQVLLDTALQTHPNLATATGRVRNGRFTDPGSYLRSLPVPVEPLEDTTPLLWMADVRDFAGLRHTVAAELSLLQSRELAEDFLLAMDEMTSNAIRHGGPPVSLKLWIGADRIVGSIGDGGPGWDDPFAGYGPAHGDDLSRGGMGLWLARQLCDHVDVTSDGRHGSRVRIRLTSYLAQV